MLHLPDLVALIILGLCMIQCSSTISIHLPLRRRGGRFARHGNVNLTQLREVLDRLETRYARTCRVVEDNSLVRKWVAQDGVLDGDALLSNTEHTGPWFASIQVGKPPQTLEFGLDMLSPDFYTLTTTSAEGSRYDTFLSETHGTFDFALQVSSLTDTGTNDERIHPLCRRPSDVFHLDRTSNPTRLVFPVCEPLHSSRQTLLSSGSVLGLAVDSPLRRLPGHGILQQLRKEKAISTEMWSATLLDSENGVLSIGGTIAREMERAKLQGGLELQMLGEGGATPEWLKAEVNNKMEASTFDKLPIEAHFKWTDLQGAAGWWTTLMGGVWVNGAKVLKNQPILVDIQSPFILAPPAAAARFYEAVGGAFRLPPPHNNFFAFPCLNQVHVAFEIGGWNFPAMSGDGIGADALHGPTGGPFSLGKLGDGTGHCLGIVVETRMGIKEQWNRSGLQDMWILGEPFFRGLGLIFDSERRRIGIRSY